MLHGHSDRYTPEQRGKLDRWNSHVSDEESRETIREFYELRPEWLALCDVDRHLLARFEPESGRDPMEVELDECTVYWGKWHNHYAGWDDGISLGIRVIEGILAEELMCIIYYAADGKWAGSDLCSVENVPSASGMWDRVSPDRRPVRRVFRSWRGTYDSEEQVS